MTRATTTSTILCLVLAAAFSGAPALAADKPRLILQITVDQLRGDLPTRYYDRLGEGGFRYLWESGVVYRDAHHAHANTETIVGHATLATGAHPSTHGMVGNLWFDRETGFTTYNVEDPNYRLLTAGAAVDAETEIEFEWAGNTARHVGSIVHRHLERIANEGLAHWPLTRLAELQARVRLGLSQLGVDTAELARASDKVQRALHNTLTDDKGRWILDRHPHARCEWPLTVVGDEPQRFVIDRSFVDDQGMRWIIDYKTGDHLGGDIARFLDDEQARYRAQLENYARIVRQLEDRPIRLALYFPLFADWRTWDYPH